MVPNAAIRNLIREDKIHQIYSQMQVGQAKFGMQTMNQSPGDCSSRKRIITQDEALGRSSDPDELQEHDRQRRRGQRAPGHTAARRDRPAHASRS